VQAQGQDERLYGLDWLRIGAFALLILYHIGMFFVPWEWHVKTARPLEWLELPMMAVNPWRLALLFVVSGFASRILLARMRGAGAFVRSRSSRLLIPLLAGMILFVAPQPWVELRASGAISEGFWAFWTQDYFRFGKLHGLDLPTWNHLWFVAYLWVYTLVLASLAMLPAAVRARMQAAFDRTFRGRGLLIWPILLLAAARIILFPVFEETHALVNDVYAHVVYGFTFFFGVGLARSTTAWESIKTGWRRALVLGVSGFAVIVVVDMTIPGESGELELFVRRVARTIQAWGLIVGLLGFARVHLNFDGPARRYLTEAIFPYYIAHQTIIVLTGYWLLPLGLDAAAEFAILITATVAGCVLTFEAGRRIGWLRPLIGLKPGTKKTATVVVPATT
jgi:peptidoglycan/LPS O-acetylase OafA/YrhL